MHQRFAIRGGISNDESKDSRGTRPHRPGLSGALGPGILESRDALQGSEKLWGAASHAITAIAMKRNWRHGKYSARVAAVDRPAEEYDEPLLATSFSVAQKFQANFYRDFMEDEEIARDRPMVDSFVRRIVDLVRQS